MWTLGRTDSCLFGTMRFLIGGDGFKKFGVKILTGIFQEFQNGNLFLGSFLLIIAITIAVVVVTTTYTQVT